MSQPPTKEGLLGLLGILDLIPSKYSAQLERNYDVAVEMWTQMSEAQWKESIGVQEGIMLYNYLHPEQAPKSSALDLNILGTALPQVSRVVYSFIGDNTTVSVSGPTPSDTSWQFRSEGLSSQFYSARRPTVASIVNHLWSEDAIPVMFFRAPPFSGKTALCTLLFQEFQRHSTISVVHLSCVRMGSTETFAQMFQENVKLSLREFMNDRGEERLLIIDEAQISYRDSDFWGELKILLQSPGKLRVILFAAYGSSESAEHKSGTPITFDSTQVFGLLNTDMKPGLYLSRSEFDEMCTNSVARPIADVIWDLCGCHAGIASAILFHFRTHFSSNKDIDRAMLVHEANSSHLFSWIAQMRGVPTPSRLHRTCERNNLTDEDCMLCVEILDFIACTFGEIGSSFSERLPVRKYARFLKLLVENGFLFENSGDDKVSYRFASSMHQK
ncbi:hypothetical protein MP638_001284, partial [Amoeboaphelidium occidentale]